LGRPMPYRHDVLRAQKLSLLAGCAVAAGLLVLDTIMGLSGSAGIPGDAALLVSRQSGALFVRVDGRLHPVANLASARLILGSPVTPAQVEESALAAVAGGPTLGIPGAPRSLGEVISPSDSLWSVCDDAAGKTTVAVGGGWMPVVLDPAAAVVVTVAGGDGAVYLLYDGKRALIDPGDPVTARALRLEGRAVRTVSPALLNAIPEVPAISPPRIAGMGQPSGIASVPVGTIVRVLRTESPEYYVVLVDGFQRVEHLTVDLLRFADRGGAADIVDAAPEVIARSPLVDTLPVATFPDEPPSLLDVDDELCATWQSGRSGIAVGPPATDGREPVTLAGTDGDGPGIDGVRMTPGRSLDVIDAAAGTRFLVTDAGVRFPVHDSAVVALGLTGTPAAAPWAIVGVLPAGPELARDAALIARDVLGSAP